jgi:hypothetical protein
MHYRRGRSRSPPMGQSELMECQDRSFLRSRARTTLQRQSPVFQGYGCRRRVGGIEDIAGNLAFTQNIVAEMRQPLVCQRIAGSPSGRYICHMISWVCPTLADKLHLRIIKTWGSGNGVRSVSGECGRFMGPLAVCSLWAISRRSPNGRSRF